MSINKLKETKIKTKPFIKLKNLVKLRERGGRESDRKLRGREKEIEKERDWSWMGHGRRDRSSDGKLHAARSRRRIWG